ncbi:MAG: DUF4384 domain-containing protein [Candidatus Zixiibacteriota bacterium]
MLRKWYLLMVGAALLALAAVPATAQNIQRDYDEDQRSDDYRDDSYQQDEARERARIDRYLDVEVWTDQSDGDYYEGDNVRIHFRANRDAFVAIYSIDSRGRVNLLFPSNRAEDNFVLGDQTYTLPGPNDDYDLVVNGPSGREYVQVIASRERFPIPNWYGNSGLVADEDDRDDYMDYLNNRYFVRYGGQRFAYDRAVLFIREWEPTYFRPIYYPTYPSWSLYGNLYIDYPWGGSVYVNGIYWGIAPLYIPRILVGWHTFTIYDPWGYCWERDVHISRYNTVVLDHRVIRTSSTVVSKFKEVRQVGYRDPVRNGYPHYKETIGKLSARVDGQGGGASGTISRSKTTVGEFAGGDISLPKKYARGSTSVRQSSRGLETTGGFDDRKGSQELSRRSVRTGGSSESQSTDRSRDNTFERRSVKNQGSSDAGSSSSERSRLRNKRIETQSEGNSGSTSRKREQQVEKRQVSHPQQSGGNEGSKSESSGRKLEGRRVSPSGGSGSGQSHSSGKQGGQSGHSKPSGGGGGKEKR